MRRQLVSVRLFSG